MSEIFLLNFVLMLMLRNRINKAITTFWVVECNKNQWRSLGWTCFIFFCHYLLKVHLEMTVSDLFSATEIELDTKIISLLLFISY
jgi:hypothetical protein